jgi:23S rRNA (uracil1939-C5)-methyltransferase
VDNLVLLAAPEGIDRVTGHVVLAGGDSPRRAREHLWKVMRGANLLGLSAGGPDEGVETVLGSVQIAGLVAPGVAGGPYEAEPAFFSQGNIFQNRVLIEQVVALADLKPGNRVVEGFAGAGNLTLALAEAGAIVEAWESHPGAVRLGIRNVKKSPFADRISLQAGNALKELAKAAPEPDVLVLDPPRSGVPGIGKLVQQLRPKRVVLVSCDMEALARDGRALAGAGFFPRHAVGIDLYPRTHHIEAVVLFTP